MPTFNLFAGWEKNEGNDTKNILDDKVLEQESIEESLDGVGLSTAQQDDKDIDAKTDVWTNMVRLMTGGSIQQKESMDVNSLIDSARAFTSSGETSESKTEVSMEAFRSELDLVRAQLNRKFADIKGMDKIDPASFVYYLEMEDQKKNPSWKRRMHRFCNGLELDTVHALHDALYLAEVAYVDSVEEIQSGVANYVGEPYELVYATSESKPREPAHFLAIKKESEKSKSFWGGGDTCLEIVLVVRGTKELADMLSDALLEASEYRGGLAHDGIKQSGNFLVEKHLPLLNHLLSQSDRKKIKLTTIGHSLGAGAAAIACIDFNDEPNIEASCIAFCCPALLNKSMSEEWKSKITTVVCDSDCVPRMSGATLANLLMNILELEWKPRAKEDIEQLLDFLSLKFPMLLTTEEKRDALEFALKFLEEKVPEKPKGLERHELKLFPPGKCFHFYRDGVGVSAVEVGCDFFNELDVSRTMVDDHNIHSGLNHLFIELMRKHKGDSKFVFRNDLMSLRQEKPAEDDKLW